MGLLLKCEHVGFGYENQDAVLDVNLEVNEGDYICIVGENGSETDSETKQHLKDRNAEKEV